MELTELSAKNFRNLELSEIAMGRGTNVVLGANGVGKTSLLEAIVVLTNLRSFRASSIRQPQRSELLVSEFSVARLYLAEDRERKVRLRVSPRLSEVIRLK